MIIKCPHCNKIQHDPLHSNAVTSAENYGSSTFVFRCLNKKCKLKYSIYFQRMIKIDTSTACKVPEIADLSY